eukprot:ANDGO_08448.mRNA.1 hypothetical protein
MRSAARDRLETLQGKFVCGSREMKSQPSLSRQDLLSIWMDTAAGASDMFPALAAEMTAFMERDHEFSECRSDGRFYARHARRSWFCVFSNWAAWMMKVIMDSPWMLGGLVVAAASLWLWRRKIARAKWNAYLQTAETFLCAFLAVESASHSRSVSDCVVALAEEFRLRSHHVGARHIKDLCYAALIRLAAVGKVSITANDSDGDISTSNVRLASGVLSR